MTTMTPDEVQTLANEIRATVQSRTCCPSHAGDVLLNVMAGFALDDANHNSAVAARRLESAALRLASDLRRGRYVMRKKQ